MIEFRMMGCCGVLEICGISNFRLPEAALAHIRASITAGGRGRSQLIFTQARRGNGQPAYGTKLAALIRKRKLGHVAASKPQRNPNTGNFVTTFVWTPDWTKLARKR